MKKLMLMAAAMTFSGAAIAQVAPAPQPAPDAAMPDPATNAPADTGTMQEMQNDPAMTQPTQTQSAQPMQAPMAQPMQQPMGNSGNMATQGSMPGGSMSGMMQSGAATGDYPRCSRTVTDRCTQMGAPSRRRR